MLTVRPTRSHRSVQALLRSARRQHVATQMIAMTTKLLCLHGIIMMPLRLVQCQLRRLTSNMQKNMRTINLICHYRLLVPLLMTVTTVAALIPWLLYILLLFILTKSGPASGAKVTAPENKTFWSGHTGSQLIYTKLNVRRVYSRCIYWPMPNNRWCLIKLAFKI